MEFEDYLIKIGIRSKDFTYVDEALFGNKEYFRRCYLNRLSPYKALTFLSLFLAGDFEPCIKDSKFGFGNNCVIHCPTYDDARKVLTIVDNYGHMHQGGHRALAILSNWSSGLSGNNCFIFGNKTLGRGRIDYAYQQYWVKKKYIVIEAKEFIEAHTPRLL
jgi:hypothetical protein